MRATNTARSARTAAAKPAKKAAQRAKAAAAKPAKKPAGRVKVVAAKPAKKPAGRVKVVAAKPAKKPVGRVKVVAAKPAKKPAGRVKVVAKKPAKKAAQQGKKYRAESTTSQEIEVAQNTLLSYNIEDSVQHRFNRDNLKLVSALDAAAWEANKFDLVVTSPPYNVNLGYNAQDDGGTYDDYLIFMEKWLRNAYKWAKPHGRLCLNIPLDKNKMGKQAVGADVTNIARKLKWQYQTTIIWNEGNISRRTAWGSWLSASAPSIIAPVELILVFSKGDWKKLPRNQSTITKQEFMDWTLGLWTFNGESARRVGHPAPFPMELPKRCIRLFSYKGDSVLDPFAGSGTTLAQAVLDGRQAYGNEIDRDYYNLALKRIEEAENKALLGGV